MRADLTEKLDLLRKKILSEQEGEEAYGPEGVDSVNANGSSAGEGGADNKSPADGLVDEYIASLIDTMMENYDVQEEDAFDFAFGVFDDLAADGTLPELPAYGDDKGSSLWLAKAKGMDVVGLVMAAAEAAAED
jgi:hypothetical protein